MDGLALCRALQADPAHQAIPIVLMSAAVDRAATSACRYAAVILKPFDLDLVLRTIVEQIGEAEAPSEPI
jgi:CheY-like chemotaxis protein